MLDGGTGDALAQVSEKARGRLGKAAAFGPDRAVDALGKQLDERTRDDLGRDAMGETEVVDDGDPEAERDVVLHHLPTLGLERRAVLDAGAAERVVDHAPVLEPRAREDERV